MEKYSYAAGGYCIIVPDDVKDLVREGRDMHNCVGSYIGMVSSGGTDVVYIRKQDDLDKSFGTMEICKGKIIQARGKYNEKLPEDALEFVEQFRQDILLGLQERRKDAV